MKALLLAVLLLASIGGWTTRVISEYAMVIENHTNKTITCYIYYRDGDYTKLSVAPNSDSRTFNRYNQDSIECF